MEFYYGTDAKFPAYTYYKMIVLVFPGNAFVNSIMNLGVFKKVVYSKIREVIVDITEAVEKLTAAGEKTLKDPKWTAEERTKIQTILRLQ